MDNEKLPLEGSDLLRFVYTCPLALLLTDDKGEIKLLNGVATSLLMPFASDGNLDNLFDLIEPFDQSLRAFLSDNEAKLKTGHLVRRVPLQTEFSDRTFHLSFKFGRFDQGYSVTAEDVTEEVAREEENRELLAAEAHQRGRVEVASGILHDLGNALTGIASRAVDIRGRVSDDSIQRNLDRLTGLFRSKKDELDTILGAGKGKALLGMLEAMHSGLGKNQDEVSNSMEKMLAFISHAQELITINRTFAGSGSDPAKGTSDLGKIMDDLQMMTSESISRRRGTMEIDVDRQLPPIQIDRSRMMQVLLNLVKNGTEAFDELDDDGMNKTGLLLSVKAFRDATGGLKIQVMDNGAGFSSEVKQKVFGQGFSTRHRGSGEGLSGCQRIMAAYGGTIDLESEGVGHGATATILLPKEVFTDVD